MYRAVCADCGKECEVPFEPDGSRPVYCKDCYQKHKKDETVKSLLTPVDADKILKLDQNNVKFFVEKAEECAKKFNISTNQIRNFYDYVKTEIGEDYKDPSNFGNAKVKLYLLKPKMACAVGRAEKDKKDLKIFQKTMEVLIDKVNTKDSFENFVRFFEAIVAYHKIYHKN